jgi:peptide deformylase
MVQQRWLSSLPSVLRYGDPRLRVISQTCALPADAATLQTERQLHQALHAFRATHGFGRAISAPQLGAPIRMIACNLGSAAVHRRGDQPFTLCNPRVTWRSTETFSLWDDCMSIPETMVRLRRHESISLVYQDPDGRQNAWERLGRAEAELMQHELDHLDGRLAVDYAAGCIVACCISLVASMDRCVSALLHAAASTLTFMAAYVPLLRLRP